ncbi:hypothetical protein F511_45097 [Dorcoceras hygrometricum]|uniref:Uncharacterized protein n=1 Tax=Dorcoceras hygrometricum TaxID=472368 RepID=A0A2Z6ZWX0_9LAMI|nr:hypothetical protein F511_45097 [Dorcoceras hygrometricum]
MVVDLIVIYGLKGPYRTLTTTNWFLQALSVIPRGSWGDVARRFTMIRWAVVPEPVFFGSDHTICHIVSNISKFQIENRKNFEAGRRPPQSPTSAVRLPHALRASAVRLPHALRASAARLPHALRASRRRAPLRAMVERGGRRLAPLRTSAAAAPRACRAMMGGVARCWPRRRCTLDDAWSAGERHCWSSDVRWLRAIAHGVASCLARRRAAAVSFVDAAPPAGRRSGESTAMS